MSEPLAVGLVGAGPWAERVHAPVLAAGPETKLAGVWARRREAATALGEANGAPAFTRFEELLDACEAVAFSVPPSVQAELAVQAARAGKGLLLEKPIAGDLDAARVLVDAIDESGVTAMVVLTWRYSDSVRAFLDQAAVFDAYGGRARFMSVGVLEGPFATPWRLERGPLLDLGPHVIDLLDAALGRVVRVRAAGGLLDLVNLLLDHEDGSTSQASLCASARVPANIADVELYGPDGALEFDCAVAVDTNTFATLRREFVTAVRSGEPHPVDVHRGLHLQEVIAAAESELLAH
jgi:predicted dehydrogenase